MAGRTLPGLGLKGDWALGEDGWKDENDTNLLTLAVFVQCRVLSIVNATPGAPAEGAIHFFGATHPTQPNSIAVYDEATWKYYAAFAGLQLYNLADSKRYLFSAGVLAEIVAGGGGVAATETIIVALSDETTALTIGVGKVTIRMPYAFTLTAVRASLTTAQTSGAILTVDINEGGASILSTKLTIDNTEKTSTTAAAAAVISDAALANDAEITFDIDQVGDGTAKGLKVYLIGHQ